MFAGLCRKIVFTSLVIVPLLVSGCAGQEPQPHPSQKSTSPPETEKLPAQTSNNGASEEPFTASQVILKYWEAMNNYDLELALSYLEKEYREREEEEVKDDLSRLKQFNVTLSVADISEPVFIDEERVRCEIVLTTPIGDRDLVYLLEVTDGEWKIYFENDPDEFVEAKEFILEFLAKYGESQGMDIIINAEQQQNVERGATDLMLSELVESGAIIESRPGVYSLPSEQ